MYILLYSITVSHAIGVNISLLPSNACNIINVAYESNFICEYDILVVYHINTYLNLLRLEVTICPTHFNNQQICILYLWVSYVPYYKHRLFP
jgi:hypothetical protein